MSNKKETAVEFLFGLLFNPSLPKKEQFELLKQAKKMEKEQIIDAYAIGKYLNQDDRKFGEQYYKETYTDKP